MVTQGSGLAPITRTGTKAATAPSVSPRPKKKAKPAPLAPAAKKMLAQREAARTAPYHFAIPLREAIVVGGVAKVCIISAGPGNRADNHFYPETTLQDAVRDGIFEGAQSYFDHPTSIEDKTQPERSVLKLAGWFSNCAMGKVPDESGQERAAIIADFHPQRGNEQVLELMRTAAEYATINPTKSYIGFSINAAGKSSAATIGGQQFNQVDQISEVISVDIVTRAGARGKLITFQEAAKMAARKPKADLARSVVAKSFLTEAGEIVRLEKSGDDKAARTKMLESLGLSAEKLSEAGSGIDPSVMAKILDMISDAGVHAMTGVDPDSLDGDEDEGEGEEDEAAIPTVDPAADPAANPAADPTAEDDAMEDGEMEDDAMEDDAMEDDMEATTLPKAKAAIKAARRESAKTGALLKKALREASEAKRAKIAAENELHRHLIERAAVKSFDEQNIPAAARPALLRKVRESKSLDTTLATQRFIRDEWSLIKSAMGGNDGAGAIVRESGARPFTPNWKKG